MSFKNLKIGYRLLLGFGIQTAFIIGLGIIGVYDLDQLAGLTDKMYKHPFTVSNSVLEINNSIVSMHRSMKDVALAQTPEEMRRATDAVAKEEQKVHDLFRIVHERFLGDQRMVDDAERTFNEWRSIRERVVEYTRTGNRDKAAQITKSEGAEHVAKLDKYMDALIDFAKNKAITFKGNSDSTYQSIKMTMYVLLIVATLVGVVFAYLITRSLVKPIEATANYITELSRGVLRNRLNLNQTDEVGVMASSLDSFVDSLEAKARFAKSIAEGDLTKKVEMSSSEDMLGIALKEMSHDLSAIIQEITDNSNMLASSSEELSAISGQLANSAVEVNSQTESVANASTQMAANISTMASNSEQMSSHIQAISSTSTQMSQNMRSTTDSVESLNASIKDVATKAKSASDVAMTAKEMSAEATQMMKTLNQSAQEIGEVSEMIKKIAEQTNLLALNANIEAASAGDAGKGFAVVANEIKELAKQSASAAENIAKKIHGIQNNTDTAVKSIVAMEGIVGTISESSSSICDQAVSQTENANVISVNVREASLGITEVARLIDELAISSRDIAYNSSELAHGSSEISQNISQVSTVTHETATNSTQITNEAQGLSKIANHLKVLIGKFKIG